MLSSTSPRTRVPPTLPARAAPAESPASAHARRLATGTRGGPGAPPPPRVRPPHASGALSAAHTHTRTHTLLRPRHVPGGGGSPAPTAAVRAPAPRPARGPPPGPRPAPRGAPAQLAAPTCAKAPQDAGRGGGSGAGGAPANPRRGALTACHCQAGCGSGQARRAARRGRVGRAGRVPYLALGWGNGSSAELRGSPPRRRGQARNRAPPSSFPVATPPSPARTRGKAGAGGFTPGTSASAWPSLSLSSSPLQPPVTPPGPGLKTSPVSVRLSPQPPRSQDRAAPRLAATRARDTCGHVTPAGTGRAA